MFWLPGRAARARRARDELDLGLSVRQIAAALVLDRGLRIACLVGRERDVHRQRHRSVASVFVIDDGMHYSLNAGDVELGSLIRGVGPLVLERALDRQRGRRRPRTVHRCNDVPAELGIFTPEFSFVARYEMPVAVVRSPRGLIHASIRRRRPGHAGDLSPDEHVALTLRRHRIGEVRRRMRGRETSCSRSCCRSPARSRSRRGCPRRERKRPGLPASTACTACPGSRCRGSPRRRVTRLRRVDRLRSPRFEKLNTLFPAGRRGRDLDTVQVDRLRIGARDGNVECRLPDYASLGDRVRVVARLRHRDRVRTLTDRGRSRGLHRQIRDSPTSAFMAPTYVGSDVDYERIAPTGTPLHYHS